ncbi:ribonuclease H-like protein [Calocera cornea HHB12733]|uniref:Ribonuclease H-like protein n=1 Tax=Calocera cornea HHB12733 TaxID=1353952 RepID=A0A165C0J5_9BASI|nr:ribonuclease H-like protein [Calocera cornea HHB12733]
MSRTIHALSNPSVSSSAEDLYQGSIQYLIASPRLPVENNVYALTSTDGGVFNAESSAANARQASSPCQLAVIHEWSKYADELVASLGNRIAFDLEWYNHPGQDKDAQRSAVLLLCDGHMALLIPLLRLQELPNSLRNTFESPGTLKAAVGISNDIARLWQEFKLVINNLVDISTLAKTVDPETWTVSIARNEALGARMLCAVYLKRPLIKDPSVRTGNWEAWPLSPEQLRYAFDDVICASDLLSLLLGMLNDGAPLPCQVLRIDAQYFVQHSAAINANHRARRRRQKKARAARKAERAPPPGLQAPLQMAPASAILP